MSQNDSAESLSAQIEAIASIGRARMDASQDPASTRLQPTEVDWLTSEERSQLHELQLSLLRHEHSRESAQSRVATKRAARLAAQAIRDLEDEVHPCGCFRTPVGGGSIWFGCPKHGGQSGADLASIPRPARGTGE